MGDDWIRGFSLCFYLAWGATLISLACIAYEKLDEVRSEVNDISL